MHRHEIIDGEVQPATNNTYHDLMDVRKCLMLAKPTSAETICRLTGLSERDIEAALAQLDNDGDAYHVEGVGWYRRVGVGLDPSKR